MDSEGNEIVEHLLVADEGRLWEHQHSEEYEEREARKPADDNARNFVY